MLSSPALHAEAVAKMGARQRDQMVKAAITPTQKLVLTHLSQLATRAPFINKDTGFGVLASRLRDKIDSPNRPLMVDEIQGCFKLLSEDSLKSLNHPILRMQAELPQRAFAIFTSFIVGNQKTLIEPLQQEYNNNPLAFQANLKTLEDRKMETILLYLATGKLEEEKPFENISVEDAGALHAGLTNGDINTQLIKDKAPIEKIGNDHILNDEFHTL